MSEYAKSNDGIYHLVNAHAQEFTLCGDAFDIDSETDGEPHAWKHCEPHAITCENCARVILACRGVRIAKGIQP